jgi:RNA polymerase sigma factor (TIGR02999 family)
MMGAISSPSDREVVMKPSPGEISQLLAGWRQGDREARDRLIALVYEELPRLARRYMRVERSSHTLQTTALVNEAYLRLIAMQDVDWQSRAHFFAIAAQVMRRILVDHARSRTRVKRGGGSPQLSLSDAAVLGTEAPPDFVALDEALARLAAIDPRKSQVVELRFFGGLTNDEMAEVLKVSPTTVMRDWSLAQAWLRRELRARAKITSHSGARVGGQS